MLRTHSIPVWKTAPFIRLLVPFMAGIVLQWYLQIDLSGIIVGICSFIISFILFSFLPIALRYKWRLLQGVILSLLLLFFGGYMVWQKDIRHDRNWYGHHYHTGDTLIVRINEQLIEKAKSFKAEGYVESVIRDNSVIACKGKLLLYFAKDSFSPRLRYGDRIIIGKGLQDIKNSGNPGAFNYSQYAAFQQLFQQVYVKENEWTVMNSTHVNSFRQFIFTTRQTIVAALRKNIGTDKDVLGIAEALLIGYTNDLDKDLVQAYSNTGVVHIIAISGMHLALIYLLLVWIFSGIPFVKRSKFLQLLLTLASLWLFSLLTGAAASVLRAAVMFSFISIGKDYFRQASIYNSLAVSAFILLCYDPCFLWDVGFQLSYLAVLGIVSFQKSLYNCVYLENKWLDKLWQLITVSLAAQVLTFPVCIYYFHQFPVLFLLANIIAVPLSSLILYAEMALLLFSRVPFLGAWLGKLCGWLLWLMNEVVIQINKLPFAVWDRIPATVYSTILLYAVVIGMSYWLLSKNKKLLEVSLVGLLFFVMLHTFSDWQVRSQRKIIVYNVPQHRAIDLVNGSDYRFIGDSVLLQEGLLRNFHLKPGRILLQLNNNSDSLATLFIKGLFCEFRNKRILFYDGSVNFEIPQQKMNIDIIIVSGNPRLSISQLAAVFNCSQYIFDASNSLWKIAKWQKECETLHLQCYSIPEKGAFISDL